MLAMAANDEWMMTLPLSSKWLAPSSAAVRLVMVVVVLLHVALWAYLCMRASADATRDWLHTSPVRRRQRRPKFVGGAGSVDRMRAGRRIDFEKDGAAKGGKGRGTGRVNGVQAVPESLSLMAGMVSGAAGVGIAFPLDTMKTRMQAAEAGGGGGGSWRDLYNGVVPTMAGQAVIKGLVFFSYELAGRLLTDGTSLPTDVALIAAACISGAVASLVVTPVERVKILCQADASYSSSWDCVTHVLNADGMHGLLFRGLTSTLLREVPAYGLYFYSFEKSRALLLGAFGGASSSWSILVPLLGGCVAGVASWLPVYPFDVVKTRLQMHVGSSENLGKDASAAEGGGSGEGVLCVARGIWETEGMRGFWVGIGPKLARAIVNHAATFFIYEHLKTLAGG